MPCDRGDESKDLQSLGKFIEDLKKEIGMQNLYLGKIYNVLWISLSVEHVVHSRIRYVYGGC